MTRLPLAERYRSLVDAVFSGIAEPGDLPGLERPLNEIELQSLWFSGAFGSAFTLADGQSLEVQDFGTWNAAPGPDFVDCAIRIEGELHRGPIELDPDVRDWERHGHGSNPEFDGVVLHVHLSQPEEARCYTRTSDHREVPQLRLRMDQLDSGARPQSRQAASRLGRCATPLREMEETRVQTLLESAAQFRLQQKSARMHRLIEAQGREQAVYQSLARTLGYRSNVQPFELLSQRLGIRRIKGESTTRRDALLFGSAGFLESIPVDATADDTRSYLSGIWAEWWKLRSECERWLQPGQRLPWKRSGSRPGNHPQRRLGALSALLGQWSRVSSPLMDATRWSAAAWRETLLSLAHPYWSDHYTLTAEPAPKPVALVGESRLLEMLANVAYPLLVPERTRLWAEYLELPARLDNQKLRRAVERLFGTEPALAKPFTRLLHQQQGLLQLYQDFCLEDDSACAECPFPEQLRDWKG